MHLCKGLHNHFSQQFTPHFQLVLRAIRRRQACTRPVRWCLPITFQMLYRIRKLLLKGAPNYTNTTLWARCCLAFFRFLRVSEFTIPTEGSYDSSHHLSLEDIAVDSKRKPRVLQLLLKQSKTDPFKQGAKVYLGATGSTICPIMAVLSYLAKRSSWSGPLFITKEGKGWTSAIFRAALKSLLGELKVNKQCYNTHSFLIGAAMCASLSNLSDTHIQLLGRWCNNAFKCYIKPPPSEVAKYSKTLIRQSRWHFVEVFNTFIGARL